MQHMNYIENGGQSEAFRRFGPNFFKHQMRVIYYAKRN